MRLASDVRSTVGGQPVCSACTHFSALRSALRSLLSAVLSPQAARDR